MLLIAGSSHPTLAQGIASELSVPFVIVKTKQWGDQEVSVEIDADLREQDVVIIQSTSPPVHDHLMELLLIAHKAQGSGVKSMTAVVPYFGYGRQDKLSLFLSPICLVARLLETAGVNKIIVLDLHNEKTEKAFPFEVINLDPTPLIIPFISHLDHLMIVSPDLGRLKRAKKLSETLQVEYAAMNKTRNVTGHCFMEIIQGDVKGKNCLLIDDILDSGHTLRGASNLLLKEGARSIAAYVTHGVFSHRPFDTVFPPFLDAFYMTNSINRILSPDFIRIIPIDKLIAEALQRTVFKTSQ